MRTGAEYFVPGHGPGGGPEVPEAFRRYLGTLYATVQELYEQDLSDFEMKPRVSEALAAYRDWFGFEEFPGPNISQAYLEVEAQAFQERRNGSQRLFKLSSLATGNDRTPASTDTHRRPSHTRVRKDLNHGKRTATLIRDSRITSH